MPMQLIFIFGTTYAYPTYRGEVKPITRQAEFAHYDDLATNAAMGS